MSQLIKTNAQINGIKKSCRLTIEILNYISNYICIGISTEDIDKLIYEKTKALGGIPATLNYNGFPKSVCTSINDVVCHGIPCKNTILNDGDIINIDVSTIYKGFFSDASRMFYVGNVSNESKRLVEIGKECVQLGIQQVKPNAYLGDIGDVINSHAKLNGYSVVKEIGGHGIGLKFHEEPWVSYVSKPHTGLKLMPGLIFTIEPMINMGTSKVVYKKNDNWTVYTQDGLLSAQWESMVLVTNNGCEVLTY